ncbi:MAG: helix-turn-helix transcriptional regulator [Telmatospirillum sp.]|nr:helix-turn-helix transcriptional regulator [Telmatospirillum sp.]
MVTAASIADVGTLVGEPARGAILLALMDGRALTTRELSCAAGITAQAASGHLSHLVQAGLIAVVCQGRHRYHRLASGEVARTLEQLIPVAAVVPAPRRQVGPRDARMRLARTCYDHIGGRLAVALTDAMTAQGWIAIREDAALMTADGLSGLLALGLDMSPVEGRGGAVPLCRLCLDWSERRLHMAGRLGALLLTHGLDRRWLHKLSGTRALDVTPDGRRAYRDLFRLGAF